VWSEKEGIGSKTKKRRHVETPHWSVFSDDDKKPAPLVEGSSRVFEPARNASVTMRTGVRGVVQ
jgi:hypothetical protein